MSFWKRHLNQTAAHWTNPTTNGWGEISYDGPVERNVRWVDTVEIIKDTEGKQRISMAQVIMEVVPAVDDYLYLGDLDDLDSSQEAFPETIDDAFRVVKIAKSPDMAGTNILYKVYL